MVIPPLSLSITNEYNTRPVFVRLKQVGGDWKIYGDNRSSTSGIEFQLVGAKLSAPASAAEQFFQYIHTTAVLSSGSHERMEIYFHNAFIIYAARVNRFIIEPLNEKFIPPEAGTDKMATVEAILHIGKEKPKKLRFYFYKVAGIWKISTRTEELR
jgi:hypothetical protein